MADRKRTVTSRARKSAAQRIPDACREYVPLAEWLLSLSFFDQVDDQLKVSRRGGVGTAGVVAYVLAFFVSRLDGGLRGFWERMREFAVALGSVAGLRELPSSSAVSRYLGRSLELREVERFGEWLLNEALDARAITHHRDASLIDGSGRRWHVLDYYPTVASFRQRALPEGEDLPEPERLSEVYAAPGYPGRKRADVQYSRGMMQHAGTGLWLYCSIGAGNGVREDFGAAVDAAVRFKARMAVDHCVLRFDGGVGGHVGNVEKCVSAGVNFVTRLVRYELLDHEDVRAVMRAGIWRPVRDSGSGPRREALDIGYLYPGLAQTRIVVSRFVPADRPRGAGCYKDGYQYEMFGTQLTPDGWSSPEVVTLYYGRCGQENRFLQEDRELNLDRTFSKTLAGQLFVVLIGLFLWNARTIRAALALVDFTEAVADEHAGPTPNEFTPQTDTTQPADDDRLAETSLVVPQCDVRAQTDSAAESDDVTATEDPPVQISALLNLPTLAFLALFNWSALLSTHLGWTWDNSRGLICPRGLVVPPRGQPAVEGDSVRIRFRTPNGPCHNCERRQQCSSSTARRLRKEVGWKLPISSLKPADSLDLSDVPQTPREHSPPRHAWQPPSLPPPAVGPVHGHLLIPSVLRHAHRRAAEALDVSVAVRLPLSKKPPPWRALSDADRQHRRLSWSRRNLSHRLPASAAIDVRYEVRSSDAKWITSLSKPIT